MLIDSEERSYAKLIAWNREPSLFALHLAQQFHLLLPSGFDEVRLAPGESLSGLDGRKLSRDLGLDVLRLKPDDDLTCGNLVWERFQRLQFRSERSGAWYRWAGIFEQFGDEEEADEYLDFPQLKSSLLMDSGVDGESLQLTLLSILNSWDRNVDEVTRPSVLLFPSIWSGTQSDKMPNEAILNFLKESQNETPDFSTLNWRQMEELVAELLKLQGMDVTVTPRSGDGGRDVIARGELIPGEPTVLAVEVKQKKVVGLGDLREALYANRDMPALLIATSGKFSLGVIKEARIPDNRYRLFLKDGVALRQWISVAWNRLSQE